MRQNDTFRRVSGHFTLNVPFPLFVVMIILANETREDLGRRSYKKNKTWFKKTERIWPARNPAALGPCAAPSPGRPPGTACLSGGVWG